MGIKCFVVFREPKVDPRRLSTSSMVARPTSPPPPPPPRNSIGKMKAITLIMLKYSLFQNYNKR